MNEIVIVSEIGQQLLYGERLSYLYVVHDHKRRNKETLHESTKSTKLLFLKYKNGHTTKQSLHHQFSSKENNNGEKTYKTEKLESNDRSPSAKLDLLKYDF